LGRVKRRLGREIGNVAALRFYRHCLTHIVLRLSRDPRWQTLLAVAPGHDGRPSFFPLPGNIGRMSQGKGDLGRRMQNLFTSLPPGPAIIVGGDIPAMRPAHIAQAFKLLGSAEAVFGRAPDGGYWLVGLKRTPKVLKPFASVRWSSPHALADTLANLDRRRAAFAATLRDIDTKIDLDQEPVCAERLIFSDNMTRK
jgi:glycosyltransferase A (GT-A) superfamily protein (DUF2064 family)